MTRRSIFSVLLALGACADDGGEPLGATADASATATDEGTTLGANPTTAANASDSTTASTPADTTGTAADGDGSEDTGAPADGVFATATFTIPAGTVVQEFSFTAEADVAPGLLDGKTLLVAVTDLSHPERDELRLCPGSHPLDGCATVDYGAFGTPHDNRITFEGAAGPLAVHLYKDRTLQTEAEPLATTE